MRDVPLTIMQTWEAEYLEARARKATLYGIKRGAPGRITGVDLFRMLVRQRLCCSGCKVEFGAEQPFEIDHDVPVARGGQTIPSNLQLLCPPCNQSKFTKTDAEWQLVQLVEASL